jgi:hypothetical protein
LPAKVPQTLAHLCLSDEPGNEVLRALKRFFSPRCERSSRADDQTLCSGIAKLKAIPYFGDAAWTADLQTFCMERGNVIQGILCSDRMSIPAPKVEHNEGCGIRS